MTMNKALGMDTEFNAISRENFQEVNSNLYEDMKIFFEVNEKLKVQLSSEIFSSLTK